MAQMMRIAFWNICGFLKVMFGIGEAMVENAKDGE